MGDLQGFMIDMNGVPWKDFLLITRRPEGDQGLLLGIMKDLTECPLIGITIIVEGHPPLPLIVMTNIVPYQLSKRHPAATSVVPRAPHKDMIVLILVARDILVVIQALPPAALPMLEQPHEVVPLPGIMPHRGMV